MPITSGVACGIPSLEKNDFHSYKSFCVRTSSWVLHYFVLEQGRFLLTTSKGRNPKWHLQKYVALKQTVKR